VTYRRKFDLKFIKNIIKYIGDVKREVSKVVFPDREEMKKSTLIVFAVCIAFALMFWGINSGMLALLKEVM